MNVLKVLVVTVTIGLLLAACGPSNQEWYETHQLEGIAIRFAAKVDGADNTSRGNLPPVIQDMRDIQAELLILTTQEDTPEAAVDPLLKAYRAMGEIIDGFASFSDVSALRDLSDAAQDARVLREVQQIIDGEDALFRAWEDLRLSLEIDQ